MKYKPILSGNQYQIVNQSYIDNLVENGTYRKLHQLGNLTFYKCKDERIFLFSNTNTEHLKSFVNVYVPMTLTEEKEGNIIGLELTIKNNEVV
jgi:hypothetical protein